MTRLRLWCLMFGIHLLVLIIYVCFWFWKTFRDYEIFSSQKIRYLVFCFGKLIYKVKFIY